MLPSMLSLLEPVGKARRASFQGPLRVSPHTAPTLLPTHHPQSAPWWPRWPKPLSSIHCPLAQVREAYLQFMTSVATMLRRDLNLPGETDLVQEEMAQVLHLETHLANVRQGRAGRLGLGAVYHTV